MRLARDARYHAHYASFGARLSRLELDIALEGEGAEAHLSGVSVLGDETHADVTTHVRHVVGRTPEQSNLQACGRRQEPRRLSGQGIGCRRMPMGPTAARPPKALLLGSRAEADLKPELEILADDVKCAHGAAVGDLDAESLFYLRARGIPENEARALLIHAFLEEAVSEIAREDLRELVKDAVHQALAEIAP